MSNTKFFNDAIAEAKAIRETALANAKLALEEAFQLKIQSMLEKQMQNEADLDEDIDEGKDLDEKKNDVDEAKKDVDEAKDMDEAKKEVDETIDEENLSEMMDPAAMSEFLQVLAGAGTLIGGSAAMVSFMDKATAGKYGQKVKKVADSLEQLGKGAGLAMRSETTETINENDFPVVEAEAGDEVGEITVDELKDIIRDVLSDVMGGGEEEEMDIKSKK